MTGKVKPLFGGLTYEREVIESTVVALEDALEAARAGEIIGVAIAMLYHKGIGGYSVCGRVGGYNMLGALEMAKAEIVAVNLDHE